MHDFCIAYKCEPDEDEEYAWVVIGKTCICPDENLWNQAHSRLKEIDSQFNSNANSSNNKENNQTQDVESSINNLKT